MVVASRWQITSTAEAAGERCRPLLTSLYYSIVASEFDNEFGARGGSHLVTKDLLAKCSNVRVGPGLWANRVQTSDGFAPLADFDNFAPPQPGFNVGETIAQIAYCGSRRSAIHNGFTY